MVRARASGQRLDGHGVAVYKRNGLYYNVFAAQCCSEFIAYSTAPTPTGPWTFRGTIMPRQGSSFTNHAGVIDFNGNSYFFYHNGALPGGGGFTRSVAVERFNYNARVASATSGGTVELRLDSLDETRAGACNVPATGGWQAWTTVSCPVTGATGTVAQAASCST